MRPDAVIVSPVIAAAAARPVTRRRRRGPPVADLENNYVANSAAGIGHNSGNRKGAGARRGNTNAVTHGAYDAEARLFRRYVHYMCRRARMLIAARKAALALAAWRA